jgi:hypothetical protein
MRTLMVAAALFAVQAGAARPQGPTLCDQPIHADLTAMHERIKQLPGATTLPSGSPDFDAVNLHGQVWSFTKSSHPAHPSVACRRVVKGDDGMAKIETQLRCNAAKEACDRLAAGYTALDKQIMDKIKQQQQKR